MSKKMKADTGHHIDILGYRVNGKSIHEIVRSVMDGLTRSAATEYLCCANPHSIVVAEKDTAFKDALQNAAILLPDGQGIVVAAAILGRPTCRKVAGYDFFYQLSAALDDAGGCKYFFLGATQQVLKKIEKKVKEEFPRIEICGLWSPPFAENFSEADNAAIISAVNEAAPDVLWLGLTAPKQEKWIYTYRDRLKVPFAAGIGAVFDFYAGNKQRSGQFWIDRGLEWLPRLLREPGRLWKRNLVSAPIFLMMVLRSKIRQAAHTENKR